MLRTLFLLGILVPGIAAALFSPFAALLMYLWYAFFRPDAWVWIDISGFRLSFLVGAIAVGRCMLSRVLPNVTHPLSLGTLLFLATALVAQAGAFNADAGWFWLDSFARLVLLCLLAVTLVTTAERLVMVVGVVAASYGFHAAKQGLASLLGGGMRFTNGQAGAFGDNNEYAIGAAMVMALMIASAQNAHLVSRLRGWHRSVQAGFYAAAVLSTFAIISTFSRAGLLSLIMAVLMFWALQRRRIVTGVVLASVVTIVLVAVPIPDGYFDRIETIQTYEQVQDKSALGRLHFWTVALDIARDRPLGIGLRNFEHAYDAYDTSGGAFGPRRAVHSSHFQVLTETGVAGALVWAGMFAYAFVLALRIRARSMRGHLPADAARFLYTTSNALATSMAAFLVGGSFISLAINELTWLTFALLAALDRMSIAMCHEAAARQNHPATTHAAVPLDTCTGHAATANAH